uniref:MIF4G-like type 2 domain-containing protein n=1 Tax=Zooxanthella nutricula TaxID=1333877 RepID=A0A7S2PD95_9DINO|mmetsp:Transcript_54011/g.164100  ORF Transcript_54011/g.164100 Transcript_54011/m.164100 type:complete len:170 (+) Transcript_54011:201-710(+)
MEFWRLSTQRLEITVDVLLQRGVLTRRAVVEHALAERGPQGCDSLAVWNILNGVARKSLEQSQTVRVELGLAKRLGKTDALETCRKELDIAVQESAELFTLMFTGLVRNHQDFEDDDTLLRQVMLQRILVIGRKYNAFIRPLIDAAESRIPGVAHNPDIAAIFHSLRGL